MQITFMARSPCTGELSKSEVEEAYEANTGKAILGCFNERGIDTMAIPGILVKNHGAFSWGKDATTSVYHAVAMEMVAEMNLKTLLLDPEASIAQYVLDKHYLGKHGLNSYYGKR